MTIFYADVSSFQRGISLDGAVIVGIKVTEGTGYRNPYYSALHDEADRRGSWVFAYHFLLAGNGAAQARWCHQHCGPTPLMLDFEPRDDIGSHPSVFDAVAFTDEFRRLGGRLHLLYFPKWYWERLGRPSTRALSDRGLRLVSSQYTHYSDSGPGWDPYGDPPTRPVVWQYTSSASVNGTHPVDLNAFKGSGGSVAQTLEEFFSIARTGKMGPPAVPAAQAGKGRYEATGTESLRQAAHPDARVADVWLETAKHQPEGWGAKQDAYLTDGDWDAVMEEGTVVWIP